MNMSILVSQETTAENKAQQETFPYPDQDLNEDVNQGIGTSQPRLQVIRPVGETSLRPSIQIEVKKRFISLLTAYLMEQDPEKQKAARGEQQFWQERHACL
jgi:hypothetical protein